MDLAGAEIEVRAALAELSALFVPEAKLSFVMRVPGKPECWMLVTDDSLIEIRKLLDNIFA